MCVVAGGLQDELSVLFIHDFSFRLRVRLMSTFLSVFGGKDVYKRQIIALSVFVSTSFLSMTFLSASVLFNNALL